MKTIFIFLVITIFNVNAEKVSVGELNPSTTNDLCAQPEVQQCKPCIQKNCPQMNRDESSKTAQSKNSSRKKKTNSTEQ
jgi:hypothetical protein